jgi:L-aspartate oxidase
VSILVQEGPDRIRDLIALGARFDREDGHIALAREGGHRRHRILHAGGDATGKEIEQTLALCVANNPNINIVVPAFAIDLLTLGNECYGVLALVEGELQALLAKATIVASGGAGQVYAHTTNSPLVTGDGIAMAYRAGAELMDMELYQFHPTGLKLPGAPKALITEAVRGEGAYLLDRAGRRFMLGRHPLAELAPRDVVARAMVQVMNETGSDHVWLDMRHLEQQLDLPERFPTVFATCKQYGLDIRQDLIPVSPVAHYFMGGIRVNYQGRTNLRGLYACGEAACLGLHGANRLASNSLLDGLVFGHRSANCADRYRLQLADSQLLNLRIAYQEPVSTAREPAAAELRTHIQQLMWQNVGLTRSQESLQRAWQELIATSENIFSGQLAGAPDWETANLATVAQLITKSAWLREESRGGHYRLDFPRRDDEHWQQHIVLQGHAVRLEPVEGVAYR